MRACVEYVAGSMYCVRGTAVHLICTSYLYVCPMIPVSRWSEDGQPGAHVLVHARIHAHITTTCTYLHIRPAS